MTKQLYLGGLFHGRAILEGLFDKRAILGELFHERVKSLRDHFFVLVDEETHRRFSFLYLEGS